MYGDITLNLEKSSLADHEQSKFRGENSRLAYLRAYLRLSWPVILLNFLGFVWIAWSYVYWPYKFTASGAVLVCTALASDVWLNHGVFRNSYKMLDLGLPVKIFAGSRVGIHLNYYVFSENRDQNEDPSNFILASATEQITGGLGSKISLFYMRTKRILLNPILALLELARPSEFTDRPLNVSSPNPYTGSSYSKGWLIGKTGNRIERSIRYISMFSAFFGTFIWAYGDLFQSDLLCNF